LKKRHLFIRGKPILSSERTLREDYNLKGSVAKRKYLVVILRGLDSKTN
jgi:hypothetical protein